jgi:hypothetical protein
MYKTRGEKGLWVKMSLIGETLMEARLKKGQPRRVAAPILGISVQYLYLIETGYKDKYKVCNFNLQKRIAAYCDMSVYAVQGLLEPDLRSTKAALIRERIKRENANYEQLQSSGRICESGARPESAGAEP